MEDVRKTYFVDIQSFRWIIDECALQLQLLQMIFLKRIFLLLYINTYISISYIILRRGCRYMFLIVTTVTVTLRYRLVVAHHSSPTRPSSAQGSYLLTCSKGTSGDARSHKWQRKKPQVRMQEAINGDARRHLSQYGFCSAET